jgi:hypothetical protein
MLKNQNIAKQLAWSAARPTPSSASLLLGTGGRQSGDGSSRDHGADRRVDPTRSVVEMFMVILKGGKSTPHCSAAHDNLGPKPALVNLALRISRLPLAFQKHRRCRSDFRGQRVDSPGSDPSRVHQIRAGEQTPLALPHSNVALGLKRAVVSVKFPVAFTDSERPETFHSETVTLFGAGKEPVRGLNLASCEAQSKASQMQCCHIRDQGMRAPPHIAKENQQTRRQQRTRKMLEDWAQHGPRAGPRNPGAHSHEVRFEIGSVKEGQSVHACCPDVGLYVTAGHGTHP